MKRRDFIKSTVAFAVAASVGDMSEVFAAGNAPEIAVAEGGDKAKAVNKAVEMMGGIERFVKKGDKVAIKPNMSFNSGPDVCANTDPEVVAAVVQLCKKAGASKISVVDHILTATSDDKSGIRSACDAVVPNCTHIIRGGEQFFKEVSITDGKVLKRTKILKDVLEADVYIAVPKAKSHGGAGVSCTLKGNMGIIYDRSFFHAKALNECIADLYLVTKPALTIIDATNVMTTNGPIGPGKNIAYKQIIAATDSVAADAYVVSSYEWYGKKVSPQNVGYLKDAAERGMGRIDVENFKVEKQNV